MSTAHCPKCREDFEVAWPSPPYSVKHIEAPDGEFTVHAHPEAVVVADEMQQVLRSLRRTPGSIPYVRYGPEYTGA